MPDVINKRPTIGYYFPLEKNGRHPAPAYGPDNQVTSWCTLGHLYDVVDERSVPEPLEPGQLYPYRTFWLGLRSTTDANADPDWVIMEDLTKHTTGIYFQTRRPPIKEK